MLDRIKSLARSPLLHFLMLGLLLFIVQNAASRVPETPIVTVPQSEIDDRIAAYRQQMGRDPTEAEAEAIERQVIENAIWLEQAFALGLHEIDTVVRQRLLLNMRFLDAQAADSASPSRSVQAEVDPEASAREDEALIARAIELGMDRSDTVVRRRLVDRVQAIVRAGVRARGVGEEDLARHYEETAERWREPPIVDLTHVYFSRDRRGTETASQASEVLERIRRDEATPEEATRLGDPFLAGHRLRGATPNRIVARLGPDFAERIEGVAVGQWFGPISSAFGEHLVWIADRRESRVPALSEIRERVVEDWIDQASRKALQAHVDERRARIDLRIIDDRTSDDTQDRTSIENSDTASRRASDRFAGR